MNAKSKTADIENERRLLVERAKAAAQFVWDEDDEAEPNPEVSVPEDPFSPIFATTFIDALNGHIQATGNLLKKAIKGASRSAEGTNVDPFHGIIEVVQNADDQRARSVRLALRDGPGGRQLLIAHDGFPVTYRNVPGMMLPYVTTKEDEADQRGRFGIGLKTLRRISRRLTVHSGPYHFGSGQGVEIRTADPEAPIPGLFDALTDTLLVIDLDNFDEEAFHRWFETWSDDSLIFLDFVRNVTWQKEDGLHASASVEPAEWMPLGTVEGLNADLERRKVKSGRKSWVVMRAHVPVPEGQHRSHKRAGYSTPISIATCGQEERAGLFVGFRTRVPTSLPFAIDAQFDPTSSRESILENRWNDWLIKSCADVLAAAATIILRSEPSKAWRFVPLPEDSIGDAGTQWPREPFEKCFSQSRAAFSDQARLLVASGEYGLDALSYEDAALTHILESHDIALLADRPAAVEPAARDRDGRWRRVLDALDQTAKVWPIHILDAIESGTFSEKLPDWWVETAATIVDELFSGDIHGRSLWLCADGTIAASSASGTTSRKLIFGRGDNAFAEEHGLFNRLHSAFECERGQAAIKWLQVHADFSTKSSNEEALRAFAEKHEGEPLELGDPTLVQIKSMLDPITGSKAKEIGAALGRAILLQASDGSRRAPVKLVEAHAAYLPKAIDKDTPNWPNAAAGIQSMLWLLPTYEERLRTGLGKAKKRDDGVKPRGAKTFLSLLGAGTSPRLVVAPQGTSRTASQRSELSVADANDIETDLISPDLDELLRIITGASGRITVKERRLRAISLIRAMARDWEKLAAGSKVPSRKRGRVHVYARGLVTAHWLSRLREIEWIPVGRYGFSRPVDAVLKNASTEAIYGPDDFVQGVEAADIPEAMAESLGFVRRVRASDLVEMLENMRDGAIAFDRGKVKLAYRHLDQLAPRQVWEPVGDMSVAWLRSRFGGGGGLIMVEDADGTPAWRRPNQVLRGRRVLPSSARYVPEGGTYGKLWRLLEVPETRAADCIEFLKEHAERLRTTEQIGELIEVYRFLDSLLASADARIADRIRHVPLACGVDWRARGPIYLVGQEDLREGLRAALPSMFFWDPPCDPVTIPRLVEALRVVSLDPIVRAVPSKRAEEVGDDLSQRFRQAVTHLSDQLARAAGNLRNTLKVSWDQLTDMKLFVYDDGVPVVVSDPAFSRRVQLNLRVHVSRQPLELHIVADALGVRGEGGRAMGSFFAKPASWGFDGEWALAWQESERREAEGLRFAADEEERRRRTEEEAARIRVARKGKVSLPGGAPSPGPSPQPTPLPPRKLKSALAGIGEVKIIVGVPPKPANTQRKNPLESAPSRSSTSSSTTPQANVAYTNIELEDFGWALVKHVLSDADGPELVDFRRRHHVGADGAFDWTRFVELKASARSMPTSVQMTLSEYARAVEKGHDYILALTSGAEEGYETKVKLIFDPVRTATVAQSESVRVSGLAEAGGIEIVLPDDENS
ncbi:hypothetical protein SKP52_14955 [Sphingopyxis fribergensis]|uniref:Protein NO VEIN C-terminal domain-containing protein n=1 Tax=Sphingopyxis fribergensis TaxID=1515612 RepID=A0A0A7PKV1_9SPHN|nr:ATP-binding protein [Sphingopyxis fribergensis]AJA09873.1 hypothetical protein SKP52_14955 [Sphingopyxis fribergensis]